MEVLRCRVKDKILNLDKAIEVGTTKKKFKLFSVAPSSQSQVNTEIENSNKFNKKEV